jgi:cysteine desulfurase
MPENEATSMAERVYLDWNATAPLRQEAREAIANALGVWGNPSSIHGEGRAARRIVEQARDAVAALVGAEARNVVFTSGGTEANMLALSPEMGCSRLLLSAIEHPSVLGGGRFPAGMAEQIAVTREGLVDLAALESRLGALAQQGVRPLVSIMLANNETGALQPVSQAAAMVHEAGGLLHADAVQAAGKISIDLKSLGVDLLTISAHKIGGPKGVGALIRREESLQLDPLVRGGGQERGHRGGTENVPGIAGFGAAAQAAGLALAQDGPRIATLRDLLEAGLRAIAPDTMIFSHGEQRLPNTTLFAVPGVKAETAVIALDLDGVAVSSGAACSSGKVAASHVLVAMGVAPELARCEVRVTLGPGTTEAEVNRCLESWIKVSGSLRNRQGLTA